MTDDNPYVPPTAWQAQPPSGPSDGRPPHPVTGPGWNQPGLLVQDKRTNVALLIVAWASALLTFLYMLPWAVAETRGKSNSLAIGLLNFLLGWTVIGWLVALVMACAAHQASYVGPAYGQPYIPQQPMGPPAGWYPANDGSGASAYWDGAGWTGHRQT